MRPAEQESLLLRQLAALRRRGLSHGQALAAVQPGLPEGTLARRVKDACAVLAAGGAGEDGADGAEDLLARGDCPVESIDLAAAALDARLSAVSALATARLYAVVAVLGVAISAWGIRLAQALHASESTPARDLSEVVAQGVIVALAALVVVLVQAQRKRQAPGLGPPPRGAPAGAALNTRAPGVAKLRRASALLAAAATGQDPEPLVHGALERTYFDARRSAVGAPQAATELAREMVFEGERAVAVFRHLGPLAAAIVYLILSGVVLVILGLLVAQWARPFLTMF